MLTNSALGHTTTASHETSARGLVAWTARVAAAEFGGGVAAPDEYLRIRS
ncbi:hypothetical protein [Streptomyces luteosporeus]